MKRLFILLFLTIIILLGGISLYLTFAVKPEKYRPLLERALGDKVGREVSLATLDFSFWGGIAFRVGDLRIAGDLPHPDEHPLRFGEGKFKMKILPLLLGKVRIKEVVINSPVLFLRKYRDGHLSVGDIIEKFKDRAARAGVEQKKEDEAIDLEIDSVRVLEGTFTFVAELPDGRVEKASVAPVNVKLAHIGFDREVKTDLSFNFVEPVTGDIDLSGYFYVASSTSGTGDVTVNVSGKALDVPVKIEGGITLSGNIPEFEGMAISNDLEVKTFAKIFSVITGDAFPVRSGGKGTFLLAAGGTPDEFGFEGEMDLSNATLFYQDKFEKFSNSELNLVFQGRYIKPRIIISNAEFRVPHMLSSIHGRYNTTSGMYEVKSSFAIAKLESVSQYFKGASTLNLSGGVTTSASIRGKDKDLERVAVEADVREVSIVISDKNLEVRSLGGHIEFANDVLKLDPLSGLLNGQRISLGGVLSLKDAPEGNFTAKASYLDMDSILAALKKGKKGKKEGKQEGGKPEKGEMVPKIVKNSTISTNVLVDTMKFREVKFQNVAGTLLLEKGKVFWKEVKVGLFDGKVQTEGLYGLFTEDKKFQFTMDCKGVSVFDFFKKVTEYGGFIDGVADMEISLGGDASSLVNIRKTLTGKGKISIGGGRIEGVDLLSDVSGVAGVQEELEQHTGKKKFNRTVTVFQDVSAPFEIRRGETVVKSFSFVTDSIQLDGVAQLTADNRFLFTGDALIPKKIAQKVGKAGKFIADKEGNLIVPIKIRGPLNGPVVALDPKELLERKKDELVEKEKEKIKKKFLDRLEKKPLFK